VSLLYLWMAALGHLTLRRGRLRQATCTSGQLMGSPCLA
jgi:hypothetical protein